MAQGTERQKDSIEVKAGAFHLVITPRDVPSRLVPRGEAFPKTSRVRERKQRIIPKGTVEVLSLLTKEAFSEESSGVGQSEYWVPLETPVSKGRNRITEEDYRKSCNKLKQAGWRPVEVSDLILQANSRVRTALGVGTLSQDQYHFLRGKLSSVIEDYYPLN